MADHEASLYVHGNGSCESPKRDKWRYASVPVHTRGKAEIHENICNGRAQKWKAKAKTVCEQKLQTQLSCATDCMLDKEAKNGEYKTNTGIQT